MLGYRTRQAKRTGGHVDGLLGFGLFVSMIVILIDARWSSGTIYERPPLTLQVELFVVHLLVDICCTNPLDASLLLYSPPVMSLSHAP